ncbi:OmpA family protein [Chryseobacterium taihuense]|uniref:OmpA family protein n=1 Tax=Chryseobacterium taihuense TaxID=1141221 RepID=A0ABY0QSG6_9FLAO|nr:OmpA family protein [Chryseobacterium taihuense]SDL73281.1 OmpA family protein [Chryseobacterium taihuense]
MALNIIDLIKGQLGAALVSQTASQLGESEAGVSKAISGMLPVIIGGLANNSEDSTVVDTIANSSSNGILNNLTGVTSGNSFIAGLLSSIFGERLSGVINSIATYAGISSNSSSSLLSIVTAATVGAIGKYASDNNLDRNGISTLLNEQKGIVTTLLPPGLSLASLNVGDWAKGYGFEGNENPATKKFEEKTPHIEVTRSTTDTGTFPDRPTTSEGGSIWKWLLPLLLLLAASYFLWEQCRKTETTTTTAVAGDSMTTDNDTVTANTGSVNSGRVDEDIDLNGISLKGYRGGMEDQMISFLKSGGYNEAKDDAALKNKWYDFDHVNFKIGSANELEAGSESQLQNLVAILKAFPEAKIKIGGYTDKTGDEAKNLKLSAERANYIKNWLSQQGVASQVVSADGYGSEFATVDASASNDERAVDRRMSVRFTK